MKQLLVLLTLALGFVLPVLAQSDAEKELLKLEDDWSNAWVKGDGKFLEQLYADEYLATGRDGKTYTKAEGIKDDLSPSYTDKSFKLSDMKVHIYGETAVVTGMNTVKYKKDGKPVQAKGRFTDVFVKRDGRWQCVATQGTTIAGK